MNTNLNANSRWTIETLEAAIAAEHVQHVGHVTLGAGAATLPAADDGAPVRVSPAQALEAIQRFSGLCWVAQDGGLAGWPEEGPDPEPDLGDYVVARCGDRYPLTKDEFGRDAVVLQDARTGEPVVVFLSDAVYDFIEAADWAVRYDASTNRVVCGAEYCRG